MFWVLKVLLLVNWCIVILDWVWYVNKLILMLILFNYYVRLLLWCLSVKMIEFFKLVFSVLIGNILGIENDFVG